MIYTLTANPSLDIKISLKDVCFVAGGKGINISTLLARHNIVTTALGFLGGETGQEILSKLDKRIIKDFVTISNNTRTNYKLFIDEEKEINSEGPFISQSEKQELLNKISKLTPNDLLIISGSASFCLGNKFYEEIISKLNNVPFIVDARSDLLLNTLKYKPELIKPNIHELEEIFNKTFNDIDDIKLATKELLKLGAKRVIVSLGDKGSLFVSNNNEEFISANSGKVLSTVGAGDAMIAGFVYEYLKSKDELKAYKSACEFSSDVVFKGILL